MKYFLSILLVAILIALGVGFYLKSQDPATGNLIIGLCIMAAFFILMPAFLYQRWKNRNISDYMLSKENIQKMKDYQKDKKI